MPLEIGGTSGPCPPCKIILNGGLMAALAPLVAERFLLTTDVHQAARRLGSIASAYVRMLGVLGIKVAVLGDWDGCEQANLLAGWAKAGPADSAKMHEWSDELLRACADLAAGKMPTQ